MTGFPYIFTFYSFKGGVGRSMALLNTAYTLAGWGKHVLIVDLDLEAPGVSGFLHRHRELTPATDEHPLDVLTLLGEVVTAARRGSSAKEIANDLPPLSNYLRNVDQTKLKDLAPKLGSLGRLDIVAAEMERDWCRRLAELGLNGMPQDRLITISTALHYYFKNHRFSHRPLGLEDFDPAVSTPYDYILIDSRTGITEIGGLCVGPLADRLVVISSLNDQNVEGTLAFLKEAGIQPEPRSRLAQPWDEADLPADPETRTLGPKPTILVASPVPNGEIEFKKKRLNELEHRIGIRPYRLSYHPQMALMESVFVRDYQDEYLAREYTELANVLSMQVGDHPSQISRRIVRRQDDDSVTASDILSTLRAASQNPDLSASLLMQFSNVFKPKSDFDFMLGRRLHATLSSIERLKDLAFYNWGNALLAQAEVKQGAEADRLFEEAGVKYTAALAIKSDFHEALNNWGNALLAQAKVKQGAEADRLFEEAGVKYTAALAIKPDLHEALNNWGNALLAQAKVKQGAEADQLFEEAGTKYAAALAIKPDKHEALNNWGNAFLAQAKVKQGAEADRLFEEAGAKYAAALAIKSDFHEALNNWGNALSAQAEVKQGAEADRLFEEAGAKYAAALAIKPDKHEALNNWGSALLAQAEVKQGAEADRLFEEAGAKYAAALAIKSDFHEALNNWGNALSAQAEVKQGAEADRLFEEAGVKYAAALAIKPDKHEALNNWGSALLAQAKVKQGADADRLFEEAGAKYAAALAIKSDLHEALNNWGSALLAQAKVKQGAEADRLFGEAGAKYAAALAIKPDKHETLLNWGSALSMQAQVKQGAEADRLFGKSREKLMQAEILVPGAGAFNLACLEALKGNLDGALQWLNSLISSGRSLKSEEIEADNDFDLVRKMPAFQSFVENLP